MGFSTESATTSWRGARSIGQRTFVVLRCRTSSASSCWRKPSRASVDSQFRNTPRDRLASSRKSRSTSSGGSRQKRRRMQRSFCSIPTRCSNLSPTDRWSFDFAPGASWRCLGTCSPGERRSRSSSQDGWRRSWASIARPSCGGTNAAETRVRKASFVGYMKVSHVKRTSRRTAAIATQKARSNLR